MVKCLEMYCVVKCLEMYVCGEVFGDVCVW